MAAEPLDLHHPAVGTLTTDRDFDVLYREHFDRLRRFCLGLTGQESLAEDVAQEALLRAYVRMANFDFSRPLWPWLKRVATNLVIDHARLARREVYEPQPTDDATCDHTDAAAERQLLNDALRALPVRQRMAMSLRYLDDWKPAEVGELLGLSRPAVEQLLLRARRRLCSEYRRLDGEARTRLRVALWPLIVFVGRIRDRAARIRQAVNDGGTSLALAADASTQAVVAFAIATVLAGGVAIAGTAPARTQTENVTVTTATAAGTRAAPAPEAPASTSPPEPAVPEARVTQPTTEAPSTQPDTLEAPAKTATTRVQVTTDSTPVADAPAATDAEASTARSTDHVTVAGTVRRRVDDETAQTDGAANMGCSAGSAVMTAACDAVETLDAAVPVSQP